MAFYNCGASAVEDGNNIKYPVVSPSLSDKLYCEKYVDNIAVALDEGELTISEMPEKIIKYRNAGVLGYNIDLRITDYTVIESGI